MGVRGRKKGKPDYSPETKLAAIDDALQGLERGERTLDIAKRHNVSDRTLRAWLIADERAEPARALFLADKLSESIGEIEAADDVLPLARAREKFRSWSWLAERRLPSYFGQRTHVTVENVGDLGERLRRAKERVIEGEKLD